MQKETAKNRWKKLELKKTAIAHLSLSEKQMEALMAGDSPILTHQTSKKIGDGDDCTSFTQIVFTD